MPELPPPEGAQREELATLFERHRARLFGIAYRMLGSAAEAEDIVQETFLRALQLASTGAQGVEAARSPEAYLVTIATRLCIDHLRSARVRREQYVGTWLPEPIATNRGAETAEQAWSLSLAFLLLLERLSPVERAVFLLREAFEYSFAVVAEITGKGESNCRQLFKRAKDHVLAPAVRFRATPEVRASMLRVFLAACGSGDTLALQSLLANDARLISDGGGKAAAALNPILGAERVTRFLLGIQNKGALDGLSHELMDVNGSSALVSFAGSRIDTVLLLELAEGRIQGVYIVRNPDKLRSLEAARTSPLPCYLE